MTIRYDDKGKYFTDVVTKDAIRADIQTLTHRVKGDVHVRIGERIKDELDHICNVCGKEECNWDCV